jgi:hypothetical protein
MERGKKKTRKVNVEYNRAYTLKDFVGIPEEADDDSHAADMLVIKESVDTTGGDCEHSRMLSNDIAVVSTTLRDWLEQFVDDADDPRTISGTDHYNSWETENGEIGVFLMIPGSHSYDNYSSIYIQGLKNRPKERAILMGIIKEYTFR